MRPLLLRHFSHLRRTPRFLLFSASTLHNHHHPTRSIHGGNPVDSAVNSSSDLTQSRILQTISPFPSAPVSGEDAGDAGDGPMNDFLSRFVWSIRPKLSAAFPSLPKPTINAMLLLICQKVVARMDSGDEIGGASSSVADDPSVELSDDLWATIWEVSNSVHEAMRRDSMREQLKHYLHCDEVKEMCRFAADVGIRGPMLRELRFKWAREKLEDVEFYRGLENMREAAKKKEAAMEKKALMLPEAIGEEEMNTKVTALPQRKGKIKYKIHGLDLSDPLWGEVAEKTEEAEKKFVADEPQLVEGLCKKVEDRILALHAKRDDPAPLLAEWAEHLKPKRVDWLALLDKIKQKNITLYFKVVEILLTDESFQANIRDYSKLIDEHSKSGRIVNAERVLQQMIERGFVPDVITNIILLHMYSNAGKLDRAKDAFECIKKEGFKPDVKVYTSMITAYVNAGLPRQGETLAREMESRDIKPTKEIYMQLMKAFAELGEVDGAQRIINTMQFAGVQPTLESYTLLVEAHRQAGDPDQARAHFDQMIKVGHKPDDRCTASMIAAYAEKNLLDKALSLLLTLEKDGFQPGISTYTALVDWFSRLQLVEEAEKLLRKIAEKGDTPFEVHVGLCDMYSRVHQEEKARKSLKILEARKVLLRADQFERIISGLLAGGLIEDAKKVLDKMQLRGFRPSERINVALKASQSIPKQKSGKRRGNRAS